MNAVTGWPAAGAGVVTLGLVIIAGSFASRLIPNRWHRRTHPVLHRLFILLGYAGATALLVTTAGQFIVRALGWAAGVLSSVGSGWGLAGVVILGVFLLLTVITALVAEPGMRGVYYAIALVFVLALVPGGFLHSILVATSGPGRAWASAVAGWAGGA